MNKIIDNMGTITFALMIFLAPLSLVILVLGGSWILTPILFYILLIPSIAMLIFWYYKVLTFKLF